MSKRGNKGQLTVIIIIAIIIIVLALLAFFLWPQISSLFMSQEQASRFLASQAEPLRQSISDCVEESSLEVFEKMSSQAGYYDISGLKTLNYLEMQLVVVMYKDSLKNRINKLPSIIQMEAQYQAFLEAEGNAKIDKCLNNLASFKRLMDIKTGERKISSKIYDDIIVIYVDWPMTLSKKNVQQNINQKPVTLLMPLGDMWKAASKIVDCEVQTDCKYEGIVWDKDVWNNPLTIQYITREARSINKDQIAFLFTSIPHRTGEKLAKFNFAIDRS